ncbi:hypothetical protein AR438_09610 [Chryseobacterium aquaticum]|uniref:Uncharacterized protein n=1 Tax=Chryseobacterium aquaticum TaxID=452084 RepID=A0A0Q3HT04_9FLAO|nr:hypothetical protein AR438_09610 [Chryseobacterium aquaticum]
MDNKIVNEAENFLGFLFYKSFFIHLILFSEWCDILNLVLLKLHGLELFFSVKEFQSDSEL